MDQQAEKKKDRKSNRTRQKNKKGDSKMKSHDSPEILDRGEGRVGTSSDIPSLPSDGLNKNTKQSFTDQSGAVVCPQSGGT